MIDFPTRHFKQPIKKPRVLIVEDEQALREAFIFLLKSEQFPFSSAANGVEALKKLPSFKPDIILLDLLMPKMDGIEFLHKAKLKTNYSSCKVVILSNLGDLIRTRDVTQFNVKKVVIKADLSPTDLLGIVQKVYT